MASENVALEEEVLTQKSALLHAQQGAGEWESRVACERSATTAVQAKLAAAGVAHEKEKRRLLDRVTEVTAERSKLLQRIKALAQQKGVPADTASAVAASAAASAAAGASDASDMSSAAVAVTSSAAEVRDAAVQADTAPQADAACQAEEAPADRADVPVFAIQQQQQPVREDAGCQTTPRTVTGTVTAHALGMGSVGAELAGVSGTELTLRTGSSAHAAHSPAQAAHSLRSAAPGQTGDSDRVGDSLGHVGDSPRRADSDRMDHVGEQPSERITAAALAAAAALGAHDEEEAAAADLARLAPECRALLPQLHWGSGSASQGAAIAETQVTLLGNIHALIERLAASRADALRGAARQRAALADAVLRGDQLAAALACSSAPALDVPAFAAQGASGPATAPLRSQQSERDHKPAAAVVASDADRLGTGAAAAQEGSRALPAHSVSGPDLQSALTQYSAHDLDAPAPLERRGTVAEDRLREGGRLLQTWAEGSNEGSMARVTLDNALDNARETNDDASSMRHSSGVHREVNEQSRSEHTTPVKAPPSAAVGPQSAPVTPAPVRRPSRGWLFGMFGRGGQPPPVRPALLTAV